MDRDFGTQTAPWDMDRVGTQFALFCHVENLPNINNVVHLCLMTIFPKARIKKKVVKVKEQNHGENTTNPLTTEDVHLLVRSDDDEEDHSSQDSDAEGDSSL